MSDGIDYAEISHNAKCLAELLLPGEPVMGMNQPAEVILNLILPGYIKTVKQRIWELQQERKE